MHQNEKINQLMILGSGNAKAYKYLDSKIRISLGQFYDSQLIGEIQIVFDTPAMYTIETLSYCNIGIIP